jgi:nucleoside-diphosphate-sugar epimerase
MRAYARAAQTTHSSARISDAVDAWVKLISSEDPIPKVINIGNPEPVTASSLADRFQIAARAHEFCTSLISLSG